MIEIGIMVSLIILASTVHEFVKRRVRGSIPSDAENRLMARMNELERRLTDIQDVVIAIDDKLDRTR